MASAVAPISPQNLHGFWAGKRAEEEDGDGPSKEILGRNAFHEDDDGGAAAKLKFGTRRDETDARASGV